MVKSFDEVFPDFRLDGELGSVLKKVKVYRMTSSKDKSVLSVYIKSDYLILKKDIYTLEKELAKQIFPQGDVLFRIYESFSLSELYTPKVLMEEYRESIEEELKNYNPLMERVFHKAELRFSEIEGDTAPKAVLKVEDTVVARKLETELVRVLDKIFNERCNVPAFFECEYVKAERSEASRMAEERTRQLTEAIVKRLEDNEEKSKAAETAAVKSDEKKPTEKKTTEKKEKFIPKSDNGAFRRKSASSLPDDPDMLFGRNFDDDNMIGGARKSIVTPIEMIDGEIGEVVVRGKIIFLEERTLRNDMTLFMLHITDFKDTIGVKLFVRPDKLEMAKQNIKAGTFVKLRGVVDLDKFDHELSISSIVGIKKIPDFTVMRMDNNPMKRVELHCHTKMSDMDGVSDVKSIIKRAKKWGMSSIAITDHGVVQAFTDAAHSLDKGDTFKVIYGCEGYLVDDEKTIVTDSAGQSLEDTFVVFDLETTGYYPADDAIIEIGAVKISGGRIVDRFSKFVNPQRPIPFRITEVTHIDDSMVKDAPLIEEVLPQFLEFAGSAVMVAHNASFDMSFIHENALRLGMDRDYTVVDTVAMSRFLIPEIAKYKLDNVVKVFNISLENHHRAVEDAEATALVFLKLIERCNKKEIYDLDELNEKGAFTPEMIMKMPAYHVIILAKNEIGRVNLYKLVSESHLKYFRRAPRIPKSLLSENREGLIIGSACEAGELFRAMTRGASEEEIASIVNFYDYLEIQPIGNNEFMLRDGKVESEEDLREFNRRIVKLGEKWNKKVCATCDVHFLDPEDEVYRRILMAGKGFDDADNQAPLYLRTTDEMLAEFAYLGGEKATEVVITNTNYIADQIDNIPPVRPDKCPPVIDRSDENLREICYKRAKEIYGEELPDTVLERLERELNSIINNGFAVMYIIAQKLVWKSNEDGYLVGSRGSVGSSFVAFLAGITEVNSLSPHYYCKKCHYTDFDSEEVKKFSGMAGCDMPDKICPNCGEKLVKDGFDIPFETFLGFKGDKEPDIDLNFSGDYQAKAHKYTEVIFGAGCTFKAGTVGTLADKTAYGYVKKYYEERGITKRKCEIERISAGCTGVRRTTGQHPGGIIVLPHGEEIYSFTAVQHPANDMTTDIVTTHFDYHSIDHNLLKLDILGHDDPTMIRFLQDITKENPTEIPLDDKKVMSLFQSTEALGITPEDIGGTKLGALGIPEFGTDFAMQMLIDTKPQYFSDLVRIAGLSHGTDVYLGNADVLIKEGKATISTAICTRDDIMIYLIQMGVDPAKSFKIMENVRKGKVAKKAVPEWPEWKEDMIAHNVPDWYIWSCEKIQYMFPKAHAAAYVMMAWRIAWFKIYYPLAYYAAFFSIRADDFSYELMCLGREKLEHYMEEYRKKQEKEGLANKEEGQLKVMRLVQEMYARGFEFMKIDITKADAKYFTIVDDKLMPSVSSIDGVGDNAADAIVMAAKTGEFLSRDDFRERSGVSKTIAELLGRLGLLGDIPESNQLSIFDFV